jgi:hypothetical protein
MTTYLIDKPSEWARQRQGEKLTPKKVDANQPEIVRDLRKCGHLVIDIHTIGKGKPDILVSFPGGWKAFEIKMPGEGQTEDEKIYQALCECNGAQYDIIHSTEEALALLRKSETEMEI